MKALERLDSARTKAIVLDEFLIQWAALTNNQLTGVADTIKEIVEDISSAYIEVAAKQDKGL